MLRNMTWVLLRPDMAWHVLGQHRDDYRGFFNRPTLCELQTPEDHLGVLAFSQMVPVDMSDRKLLQFPDGTLPEFRISVCKVCEALLCRTHQLAKVAGLSHVFAEIRPLELAA